MTSRPAGPARAALLAAAALVVALSVLAGAPGVPGGPGAVRAMGPLPACRYDDILTSPRGYGSWETTLVDTILRVSRDYVPPDLVSVAQADIGGKGKVRAVMIDDLREMAAAAKAADAAIAVHSAYRSYATQQQVFAQWVAYHGRARALQLSARPGHSEHQLGVAVDFRSDPPVDTLDSEWGKTAAGRWMRNHAWEYGFVMSYPKGKLDITCYDFEPWHFKYVGRDVAAAIHASGLTQREYLWANYTTTVVPAKTPKPHHSARPTETPPSTVQPSVEPSVAPTFEPTREPPSAPPSAAAPSVPPTLGPPTEAPATEAPALPPLDLLGSITREPVLLASLAATAAALLLGLVVIGWKVLRRGRTA
jgi:D-alanyl-D-alanine carboxypeptidase